MKTKTMALWAVLLIAAVGLGACARYSAMKGPFKDDAINPAFVDHVVEKTERELDLTTYQSDRFRALVEKGLTSMLEQRPQKEAVGRDLALMLRQEHLSKKEVAQLLNRKGSLIRTVLDNTMDDFIAWHALLDDAQRNELAELVLRHEQGPHGL
ncbi:hypothetical protein DPQ33_08500 [Oceanidesulfovibrio indonesiensis]|uniref:Periplasmic heavy metal sensor n=1 Tax=Oceanidesulfovibrio indonesiensis TaxID=54767 RepID=A0A7M3MFV9_9BACT|nr:hypothetical protein [Oceanidesulfovibrio indonesiensis]TVM17670.1 hypothetical protein DPQ33_08500 [Oceanidesulfovibrio indonesiensis]